MTTGIRSLLVVVVLVGSVSLAGIGSTHALFSDADGGIASATASTNFGGNGPSADAGGPYTVNEGASLFQLDGTGTSNAQSYSWQIVSGPGSMWSTTGAEPYYDPPDDVASDTTATVELTATDSQGNTDTDTATITVRNVVNRPTVNYMFAFTWAFSDGIQIYTGVEDPASDNDQLDRVEMTVVKTNNGQTVYDQSFTVSGDSATLWKETQNLGQGEYRVTVTVYDESGHQDSRTKTVTISNNALATSSTTVSRMVWEPGQDRTAGLHRDGPTFEFGPTSSVRDDESTFAFGSVTDDHEIANLAKKTGAPDIKGKLVGEAGNGSQEFVVLAGVTDPRNDKDDLASVEVTVVNTTSGATAYHTQRSVSGQRAKVDTQTTQLTAGQEYRIDITATDSDGNAVTDSVTKTMSSG